MSSFLQRHIPHRIRFFPRLLKTLLIKRARRLCERCGLIIARRSDYYTPISSELDLRQTVARWNKPSALRGVNYDLQAIKDRLTTLAASYHAEFAALPSFDSLRTAGYGPGYTKLDAFTLYGFLRQLQPRKYLEVGSGLSTYYAHL